MKQHGFVTDLVPVLEMIDGLIQQPRTTERLMTLDGVSNRTITRRIATARGMGVELQSRQMEVKENGKFTGPYYWFIRNPGEIRPQLKRWLAIERNHNLTQKER